MSEDSDYTPGAWAGHDFKSARAHYDGHAGRSYSKAASSGKAASDCYPAKISTNSTSPLVIMVDVTGSMGSWPATMFSKLPYLDLEGKEYLGDDMEIAFGAVGDATCDSYPVQVRDFKTGTALKDELGELVDEHGGGGGAQESYELGALYYAFNAEMPNAVKPIFIFVADEAPYPRVTRRDAKTHAGVEIDQEMSVEEVFEALKQKFSVYLVHKRYGGGETRKEWVRLIGEDHIADLQDPNRVVDVIFGILAQETGRVDYFRGEIEDRQDPDQVKTAYKALKTIHAASSDSPAPKALLGSGKSRMHAPSSGPKTKSLI